MTLAKKDTGVALEDPENFESAVREVRIVSWSSSAFVFNAELDAALTLATSEKQELLS
jgi:hypothetical protein